MPSPKADKPPILTFANPEGLAVLAAAAVTAAVAAMPVIIVPGVLAYGILTWLRYRRWKEGGGTPALEAATVDLSRLRHPYSARVSACVQLQTGILSEIANAEPTHRSMLVPSIERVKGLATAASELAYKLQQIEQHLSREDRKALENEGAFLQSRIHGAQDAVAKERFERAYDQHRQKLDVFTELRARWERIDAQLTNIQLTLETVAAQVLRIKSAEAGTASHESVRVIESLDALSIDVQALAETVEETVDAGSLESNTIRGGSRER